MVRHLQIGKFGLYSMQLWPVEPLPIPQVILGSEPAVLEAAWKRQPSFFGQSAEMALFTQNVCLIQSPQQLILVDTGLPFERGGAMLEWALGALGHKPADIDLVFLTHAHEDHLGGCVDAHGAPQYPNAQYLIAEPELTAFSAESSRAAQFAKWLGPIQSQLQALPDNAEILPGLSLLPTPGHTAGATSLRLQDGDQAALILADCWHMPLQVSHPHYSSVWDINPALAHHTRAQLIAQALEENLILAAPHIPLGGLGRVVEDSGISLWQAI